VRKRLSCCLSCALEGCDYCATCPVWSDQRATELAAMRLGLPHGAVEAASRQVAP